VRRLALLALAALVAAGAAHAAGRKPASPQLFDLRIDNGSTRFAGDSPLLTTVSPNDDGFRDTARIHFRLTAPAVVKMDVTRTVKVPQVVYTLTESFGAGGHTMVWSPAANVNPRTYLVRMTVTRSGKRTVYGSPDAFVARHPRGLVVRLQGIDAGFARTSYAPGQLASLHIASDEPSLELEIFQSGPEKAATRADNVLQGTEIDQAPVSISMTQWQSKPRTVTVRIPDVPSGLYFAQLTGLDGRVGYAPFVVHPVALGVTSRVLVVLPTNTWEAYNFQDVDGNGYGDTWYAGPPNNMVDLSRTYIARGVPPRFYKYDLPFLHWLYWSGKSADFISDSDFDQIANGDELASDYDLVIFEGHEEYVATHEYDVVQRFRDLGGNLMFLSANNFFWKVNQEGNVLRKVGEWRDAGRPEAALIGVQYRANDDGQKQGAFILQNTTSAPWLWNGTGLDDGSLLGQFVGGYGIEIDGTSPSSPPGTIVLAQIPDLFGPGVTAQMSYYETAAGAKVFAAGALDFGGSSTFWPVRRMLDNLWVRLSQP
jgi:hypothetical protein